MAHSEQSTNGPNNPLRHTPTGAPGVAPHRSPPNRQTKKAGRRRTSVATSSTRTASPLASAFAAAWTYGGNMRRYLEEVVKVAA